MRAEAQAHVDKINDALALLRRFLDWDRALRRLDELNARVEDQSLWNDPKAAQEVMRERRRLDEASAPEPISPFALAMPAETTVAFVIELARGLRAACDRLAPGCAVEGGDLTVSDTLTIAVTALGSLDGRPPVLRSGARPGDVVAIAGDLGRAARGLELLFGRFRDAAGAPVPVAAGALTPAESQDLRAQLRPSPPIGLGVVAADAGATAMMDVSDGLVLDATRMADASGASIDLIAAALGAEPRSALTGGEDHALLAAFPAGAGLPEGFRPVGVVRDRTDAPVLVDGAPFGGRGGWDPYRDWDQSRG